MAHPPDPPPRLLALGDSAWTLEFGRSIEPAIHARVVNLAHGVAQARPHHPLLAGVTDVVPALCSLTVHFDPWQTDAAALGAWLLAWTPPTAQPPPAPGRCWLLPVCFDADFAPDLPHLAAAKGLRPAEVIEGLLGAPLRVCMIGFQPGFAYLGGVPSALHMPRRSAPRQRVPAHSVAVAGSLCAVYPWDSPGGWNLLGRTPVQLFDPRHTEQPALLAAGDEVRWAQVDRKAHDQLARDIAQGLPRQTFLHAAAP